ncbi:MAG: isoleucine--tRNA ligase, partial [Treponema sp.]|nr:isoleucine--tRNA ligase [Treponema sp.]
AAAAEIAKLSGDVIAKIVDGAKVPLNFEGGSVELDATSVIVERTEKADLKVVNDGTLTVGLDTKITDELKKEGYARDAVRGIQNLRKESGFEITDRINLKVSGNEVLKAAFDMFKDFIAGETLSSSIEWVDSLSGTEIEADDAVWTVSVSRC